MTKEKEVAKETVTDDAKDGVVVKIQKQVNEVAAMVRKIKNALERQFGIDIDRDGKVGGATIWGMIIALALASYMAFGFSPDMYSKWQIVDWTGTNALVSIDSNGNLTVDGTLTAHYTNTASSYSATFGSLTVQTNALMSGTLSVVGNTTLTGTLTVAGNTISAAAQTNAGGITSAKVVSGASFSIGATPGSTSNMLFYTVPANTAGCITNSLKIVGGLVTNAVAP